MKKYVIVVLAMMLLLCACQAAVTDPSGISTGEIVTTAPSTVTTAPTVESTAPTDPSASSQATTAPTEPTERLWPGTPLEVQGYMVAPWHISVKDNVDGEKSYGLSGWYFQFSNCIPGHLYLYNAKTQEQFLICDERVEWYETTEEHVFYITEADPRTLMRCDLEGKNHEVLYRASVGDISDVSYYGTDPYGKLGVLENDTHIFLLDLATGETKLIYTAENIYAFLLEHWEKQHIINIILKDGTSYLYNLDTGDKYVYSDGMCSD